MRERAINLKLNLKLPERRTYEDDRELNPL
jgi:hypothetical protein